MPHVISSLFIIESMGRESKKNLVTFASLYCCRMKKGGALEIGSDINSLKLRIHELEKQLDDLKKTGDSAKKDSEVRNEDNSDLSLMFNITLNLLETVEKRKVLRKIIEGAIKLIGLDIGVLYMLNDGMLFLEASVPEIYTDYPREFRIAKLDNHLHIKNYFF